MSAANDRDMIGTVALFADVTGHPWPGGERVRFEAAEVRALGKMTAYNDFVTRYLARLADGRVVFVKMGEQSNDEQVWLAAFRRAFNRELRARPSATYPTRDLSFVITWKDV
jgi:hypothetical protein